jgi:serine/threonine-protein kinase
MVPPAETTAPLDESFPLELDDEPPYTSDNAFEDDGQSRRSAAPVPDDWTRRVRIVALLVVVVGAAIVAIFAAGLLQTGHVTPPGTFAITTTPAGVPVMIDSVQRGVTPLQIELPPGKHVVQLVGEQGRREIPITIKSGAEVSQFIELSAPAPAVTAKGELQVRTDPTGASVTVDGRSVGRSPVSVADLEPGPHSVQLASESGAVTERVLIEPGRTASLFVPLAQRAGPGTAGWIAVAAPADVQVFEGDKFLGNNRIDRIMLPVGRHDLDIVNEPLGYRERRTVQVAAGQVSAIRLNWPNGTLALNAVPWAEAFVDGMPVGETPIGGIQVSIGVHEIVFRHPELGERRATVAVTVGAPAKVGVDLRSK